MKRILVIVAAVMVLGSGTALAQTAEDPSQSEPPPGAVCDQGPSGNRCIATGSGGDDVSADDGVDGESVFGPVWGPGQVLDGVCEGDPPRPRVLQWLVWGEGPDAGEIVHAGDVGEIVGRVDQEPLTPDDAVISADGNVYRTVCVDVSVTVDVWEEVERRRSSPGFDKDPVVWGLTGLETWVWYGADPQVAPFGVTWADPETGATIELEAWAWISQLRWDFGDGGIATTTAATFEQAPAAAGSHEDPAGTHMYETTSTRAGFPDGYPVSTEATWVGEWRWNTTDGWSAPVPMATTVTDRFDTLYQVVQIRSVLQ